MSMNLQCESKYIKMMGRLKATSLCLVPISISISIELPNHELSDHKLRDNIKQLLSKLIGNNIT